MMSTKNRDKMEGMGLHNHKCTKKNISHFSVINSYLFDFIWLFGLPTPRVPRGSVLCLPFLKSEDINSLCCPCSSTSCTPHVGRNKEGMVFITCRWENSHGVLALVGLNRSENSHWNTPAHSHDSCFVLMWEQLVWLFFFTKCTVLITTGKGKLGN